MKTKKESDLPTNERSDERAASDPQRPDPQRRSAVSRRIHFLQIRRAKSQWGTNTQPLKNPSDHDTRIGLGHRHAASRNEAFGKREQEDRPSSVTISEWVPKQDPEPHHQRVRSHEIGHIVDRPMEKLGHL